MNKRKRFLAETIQINLSTPFLQRAKCKFCEKGPSYYYCCRNTFFLDATTPQKYMQWVTKHNYRICTDDYLFEEPKQCTQLINLSYQLPYKGYTPTLHRCRGVQPRTDFIEYVICKCGKTTWQFYYRSAKNRPEIINRKCRNNFPKKFLY